MYLLLIDLLTSKVHVMSRSDRKVATMKNKAQKQAEERASKNKMRDVQAGIVAGEGERGTHVVEGDHIVLPTKPKAEAKATTPATPAPAGDPAGVKQAQTIQKLTEGWTARGVDLSKLTVKDDGKFKLLIVAPGWPTVQVGASGGVVVLELKSYPDAYTGAMEGLERYTKQQAREEKQKAAAAAPAVATKSATPEAPAAIKTKAAA